MHQWTVHNSDWNDGRLIETLSLNNAIKICHLLQNREKDGKKSDFVTADALVMFPSSAPSDARCSSTRPFPLTCTQTHAPVHPLLPHSVPPTPTWGLYKSPVSELPSKLLRPAEWTARKDKKLQLLLAVKSDLKSTRSKYFFGMQKISTLRSWYFQPLKEIKNACFMQIKQNMMGNLTTAYISCRLEKAKLDKSLLHALKWGIFKNCRLQIRLQM